MRTNKKICITMLTALFFIFLLVSLSLSTPKPFYAYAEDGLFSNDGGDGESEETAYCISTALQLRELADYVNLGNNMKDKYIKLTKDIDLSKISHFPTISKGSVYGTKTTFKGAFDGCGHTVSNMKIISQWSADCGLFGYLSAGAKVKNLNIINVKIQGSNKNVGIVAGTNYGVIENCKTSGNISRLTTAGGIAGYNYGTITNCSAAVNAQSSVAGGIAGYNEGTIMHSSAAGSVVVKPIERNQFVSAGGLVGKNEQGQIIQCFSSAYVSSESTYSGALAGVASNESTYSGALVGVASTGSSIKYCYSIGDLQDSAGSNNLIGANGGEIESCYAALRSRNDVTVVNGLGETFILPKDNITSMRLSDYRLSGDCWDIVEGNTLPFLKGFEILIMLPYDSQNISPQNGEQVVLDYAVKMSNTNFLRGEIPKDFTQFKKLLSDALPITKSVATAIASLKLIIALGFFIDYCIKSKHKKAKRNV